MTVCEEYIGLMPVAQPDADTTVICIKNVMLCMNLRIQDGRGQCHDGCSTMTGTKNGVAAQIKKLIEKCLLMHCYCHSLNLAAEDTIKIYYCWKTHLMWLIKSKLIKKSPKRKVEFHRKHAEFLGQMERDFHVQYGLTNSENPLPNKVDCPSCIAECYSEELWNFDEAVGMGIKKCQWLTWRQE